MGSEIVKINSSLIILDLETTGTWIEKDKIIEIAMIKFNPNGEKVNFHSLVNPSIPIPSFVTELTGITNEDVKDAPCFKDICNDVINFIGVSDLAGFNIERFDLPLLEREIQEAGLNIDFKNRKIFDAQKVYHINEKRDLKAAYKFYCNKTLTNAHSASNDVEATYEILLSQVEKYGKGNNSIEVLEQFSHEKGSDFYDSEGKFRWWNKELYATFGKYSKQLSIREVAAKDPDYLRWILTKDFSEEVKKLIQDALSGKFPVFKEDKE
jgi:DNA polymerase-3 subunit epsilon